MTNKDPLDELIRNVIIDELLMSYKRPSYPKYKEVCKMRMSTIDKRLKEQFEDMRMKISSDILQFKDDILTEIKAIREELIVMNHQIRRVDDKLDTHIADKTVHLTPKTGSTS